MGFAIIGLGNQYKRLKKFLWENIHMDNKVKIFEDKKSELRGMRKKGDYL